MATITLGTDGSNPPTPAQTRQIREALEVSAILRTTAEGAPDNTAAATGVASFALNPTEGRFVFIGGTYYVFRAVPVGAYDVEIGVDLATSLASLEAGINSGDGFGGTAHPTVTALADATTVTVTAITIGTLGNQIPTTSDVTGAFWLTTTLSGGVDAIVTTVVGQRVRAGDAEPYAWHEWSGDAWELQPPVVDGRISAEYIELLKDGGTPDINTLAEYITMTGSTGVSDGSLIYVTEGTTPADISVAAGEGLIRESNDEQATLKTCTWDAAPDFYTFAAPAAGFENIRFIGVEYSGGVVSVVSKANFSDWNWYSNFPLARATYDGTELHLTNAYAHAADTADLTRQFLRTVLGFRRENTPEGTGGLEMEATLQELGCTGGNAWLGFNKYVMPAVTLGDPFNTHWDLPGGDFGSANQTDYPNTQYNDGTGLVDLTNNRYGALWVYRKVAEGHLDLVYGAVNATSVANAQEDVTPAIPEHLKYGAFLVARIIFKKGETSATLVESAWDIPFQGTQAGSHELLSALLGGAPGEYYHLTNLQHAGLTGLTVSEMVIADAAGNLVSAPVATYPSLTELAFLKGATSNIQAQLNVIPLANYTAVVAPAVTDDSNSGYSVGSPWYDTVGKEAYRCVFAGVGVAEWIESTFDATEVQALIDASITAYDTPFNKGAITAATDTVSRDNGLRQYCTLDFTTNDPIALNVIGTAVAGDELMLVIDNVVVGGDLNFNVAIDIGAVSLPIALAVSNSYTAKFRYQNGSWRLTDFLGPYA